MSLKRNIVVNYISLFFVTVVGIVMVPLYITYMGAEAYGLVGFFAMLQAWFNLLDLGLTPTIARETARFRGGALDALGFRRLVRALEGIFLIVAVLGGMLLLAGADPIATRWLNASQIPSEELVKALQLMAVVVAMRWMCGLYRGVVSGSEHLVWLAGFNAAIATLRFVCVLPLLMFVSTSPSVFFAFQLLVSVLELAGLAVFAYGLLPPMPSGQRIPWEWAPIKPMLKFSLTIAFTSSVWVLVTQTDKLILSGILPLAEFAYFTLAVLVASGITVMSSPISNVIMPRMARLHAEANHDDLIRVYRRSTQLVSVIAGSSAISLAFCAEPLLYAWSGDRELTANAAPILRLYSIGNGFLAVAAFPYYLQYAKGDLRYHLIGNAAMVTFIVAGIIYAATRFGGVGAGYVWVGVNALYLFSWVALIHSRLEPGLHWRWISQDVLSVLPLPIGIGFLSYFFSNGEYNRWQALEFCFALGFAIFLVAALSSGYLRSALFSHFRNLTSGAGVER